MEQKIWNFKSEMGGLEAKPAVQRKWQAPTPQKNKV